MEERILARMRLQDRHRPTGKTRHYSIEGPLPPPAALKIVQYGDESGFYLLYLDESGREMTDTWHESLENAKRQAAFEFNVDDADWESP